VQIRWDEIPAEGIFFRIEDGGWVPRDEVVCQAPPLCTVSLKKEAGRVLFAGTLHLSVVLDCDRCLDSFVYALAEEFEVVFEMLAKEEEAGIAAEHCCKSSELDVVFLAEPVVDVFSVLVQQLYLALPDKRLCSDKCLGLCPECGANLNRCPCDCTQGTGASPFQILAKLKVQ
jgi:uncharacterized protein